jgi:alpha-ketoglutarate-dependent taurine dioxygenase
MMVQSIELRSLSPAFGAEVIGFEPTFPLDDGTIELLRAAFDERSLLVFRDLDIDHPAQVYLTKMLIGQETDDDDPVAGTATVSDSWYISNEREGGVAPHGRLQFHVDGMWADHPFQVLSLWATAVDDSAPPTIFVSNVEGWRTLPDDLRARAEHRSAVHTTGEVRRGDLTDVMLTTVEKEITTTKPLGWEHPRTGAIVLYASEQMTREVVGLDHHHSEALLAELFAHLYADGARVEHHWQLRDLVVWDNIAVQHARPNLPPGSAPRTMRKVGHPMPTMAADEMPVTVPAAR